MSAASNETVLASASRPGAVDWFAERRVLFAWWAGSRTVVVGCALALHGWRSPRGFFGSSTFDDPLGVLRGWDGQWYTRVAMHGYLLVPGKQSDPAFFPLYPIVLRAVHSVGFSWTVSGVLISNLAFLGAMLALYELSRHLLPEADALRAARYAAIFPAGFVFSMVYPESLALVALALAAVFALRGRFGLCAVAAGVAALARPEGVFIAIPIAVIAWRQRQSLDPIQRGAAVGAVLSPLAAAASFPLYLHSSLRDITAWQRAEHEWGRSFSPGGLLHAVETLGRHPWLARDTLFVLIYLVLLAIAFRAGLPRAWIVAGLLIIMVPLASGSFTSEMRFGLLAPAVYWGLAILGRRRRLDRVLVPLFVVLLAAFTFLLPLQAP
jgi:hypothetical protein